jgi:hypothetical protein
MGIHEWTSLSPAAAPAPLKAAGGGVLGHKPSTQHILMQARIDASPQPVDVTVVRYVGYMALEQLGALRDHIRAMYLQAQRRITSVSDDGTEFHSGSVILTIGNAARIVMERMGVLKVVQATDQYGKIREITVLPGKPVDLDAKHVHYLLEGPQAEVMKLLDAFKQYSGGGGSYCLTNTNVVPKPVQEAQ